MTRTSMLVSRWPTVRGSSATVSTRQWTRLCLRSKKRLPPASRRFFERQPQQRRLALLHLERRLQCPSLRAFGHSRLGFQYPSVGAAFLRGLATWPSELSVEENCVSEPTEQSIGPSDLVAACPKPGPTLGLTPARQECRQYHDCFWSLISGVISCALAESEWPGGTNVQLQE